MIRHQTRTATPARVWPLSLTLALVALPLTHTTLQAQSCGVERWSVKTGTDADVGLINLSSTSPTTISTLRSPAAPNPIPPNNRVSPLETTVWVVNATLTQYKLEGDSDYHLVLSDAAGNTMIAEIPEPACVGTGSPFATGISNARAKFDAAFNVTSSFQTANIPVQVTGVGMFDFLHGQTGVAPNGIELHPVLDIVLNPATNPDFSIQASPGSVSAVSGASGTTTITTTIAGGFNSAVSLGASGLPPGATASFSPSTITSPGAGSSTLTLSAGTAAAGTYTVTVQGTGGGKTRQTTVSFVVTASAVPDFSLSVSPSSASIAAGSSTSASVATMISGGFSSTVALSATGMPAGASAAFSPPSLAAPGSGTSILTLSAGSAVTGTYNLTLSGSGGGKTHTVPFALTITSSGTSQQLLKNPGFESGATSWTATSGVISNSSSEAAHTGTWKAWLDGYGTTHTDTIYQQVAIPSTVTSASLTFWLHIDTAETTTTTVFDTLTLQVRNSSGTVLATLASFSNLDAAPGYMQQAFDLSAYKGQTIRVYFVGAEDHIDQTSFVLDDFALTVQ